jgi:hypothetical protein
LSFLVAAALAVGLLVAIPVAAHLLRLGRTQEQEFAPARLVPVKPHAARRRSQLENRVILALRVLIIAALAALGATPLLRCSRLSLARQSGASVALALIVDDSLSMQTSTDSGQSRWNRALAGARELLGSARDGDAVAIVLAGRPARLALAASTDLAAAKETLAELEPSDRATDLHGAVQIARSAVKHLSHVDKRIILLSDLADARLPAGQPSVWAPLEPLRRPSANCGVFKAARRGQRVTATVACSAAAAARGRRLQLVGSGKQDRRQAAGDATDSSSRGRDGVLAEADLAARRGAQTVSARLDAPAGELDARLTGTDALGRDDVAPVGPESSDLAVAVVVDQPRAASTTGGATVLEQALVALQNGAAVRPLAAVPDDPRQLSGFAALILDDPPGLHAQARSVLLGWLERGGVAMALLGPRAHATQLGSTLEPFASGAVSWQPRPHTKGINPNSVSWLGDEAKSLVDLAPQGRALLDGAEVAGAGVLARWDDGRAWLLQRSVGQGVVLTVGLPASPELSELALRPGWLSLLDHVVTLAGERTGPVHSPAGVTWQFPAGQQVHLVGPKGPVPLERAASATEPDQPQAAYQVAVAPWAGRYVLKIGNRTQQRVVGFDEQEIVSQPALSDGSAAQGPQETMSSQVDASAELAVAILWLFCVELLLRLGLRLRRRVRSEA